LEITNEETAWTKKGHITPSGRSSMEEKSIYFTYPMVSNSNFIYVQCMIDLIIKNRIRPYEFMIRRFLIDKYKTNGLLKRSIGFVFTACYWKTIY
jgi:hypothetical protein